MDVDGCRLEFDNQKSRVSNQLEYENSLDTFQNVVKWRDMIKNDEANIEQHKREEKRAMKVLTLRFIGAKARSYTRHTRGNTSHRNGSAQHTIGST